LPATRGIERKQTATARRSTPRTGGRSVDERAASNRLRETRFQQRRSDRPSVQGQRRARSSSNESGDVFQCPDDKVWPRRFGVVRAQVREWSTSGVYGSWPISVDHRGPPHADHPRGTAPVRETANRSSTMPRPWPARSPRTLGFALQRGQRLQDLRHASDPYRGRSPHPWEPHRGPARCALSYVSCRRGSPTGDQTRCAGQERAAAFERRLEQSPGRVNRRSRSIRANSSHAERPRGGDLVARRLNEPGDL